MVREVMHDGHTGLEVWGSIIYDLIFYKDFVEVRHFRDIKVHKFNLTKNNLEELAHLFTDVEYTNYYNETYVLVSEDDGNELILTPSKSTTENCCILTVIIRIADSKSYTLIYNGEFTFDDMNRLAKFMF